MVTCPKCGITVLTPLKSWVMPTRTLLKKGEESKIVMGIFECPNCRVKFRAIMESETKVEQTANIKNMVERIIAIRGELMQTLRNLREKIKILETERANLIIEIEKLKKVAESRVNALENEVTVLRDELKSLRDLLGYTDEPEKIVR